MGVLLNNVDHRLLVDGVKNHILINNEECIIFNSLKLGDSWIFLDNITFVVPETGIYKLETAGAGGANYQELLLVGTGCLPVAAGGGCRPTPIQYSSEGGYGGYNSLQTTLYKDQSITITIGKAYGGTSSIGSYISATGGGNAYIVHSSYNCPAGSCPQAATYNGANGSPNGGYGAGPECNGYCKIEYIGK